MRHSESYTVVPIAGGEVVVSHSRKHTYMATAGGISLVYENGTTIVLRFIDRSDVFGPVFWRAVVVEQHGVPQMVNAPNVSDGWLR